MKDLVKKENYSILQWFLSKADESIYEEQKNLLEDPNTFLSYDQNGQSQLATSLYGFIEEAKQLKPNPNIKTFEILLDLFICGPSSVSQKRIYLTIALYPVFSKLPEKVSR